MATVEESTLALVRQHMRGVRVPSHGDKVHKEECMYSFDTPESPGGLYISLSTFQVRCANRGPVGMRHGRHVVMPQQRSTCP
jgi:uncharacterized UBP type Zn finger protein